MPHAAQPSLAQQLGAAADAVAAVRQGRSLTDALAAVPAPLRPGAQALAFHAMRWLGGAEAVREALAPRRPPPAVESLLLLALALLWPDGSPPYAPHTLVDQAVACARQRASASASFVNAVLRRFLREVATLVPALRMQPEVRWQHPAWWVDRLRADWPAQWQALLEASNRQAPMVLRANARHLDAQRYGQLLAAQGIEAHPVGTHAVRLVRPLPVTALPGFDEGWVSVQDTHAQLAGNLLLGSGPTRLRDGARVLDACAAPGGKTAQLLELAELDVLALDIDAGRLARVEQTLARLRLSAQVLAADAAQPDTWWDGRPFDAILLDAPCSASGIVRRHPDVRWLRRPGDIAALAKTQARLLDALWPLLAPGGRLLYATCSLFRAEGEQQAQAFLARQPGASALPAPGHLPVRTADAGPAVTDNSDEAASRTAPPGNDGDGFFYALLEKSC